MNGRAICLMKVTLKERRVDIPITVFGKLIEKVKEKITLPLTDFRFLKYVTIRFLKNKKKQQPGKQEMDLLYIQMR